MSDPSAARQVLPVASLTEYFRDSLHAALGKQQLAVGDHTQHYVVNVLTLFARSEALFEPTADGLRLKPLVAMLSEALAAPTLALGQRGLQRLGAHRDVVIDVHELAREAAGEKPRDEQRHIAQALQPALAFLCGRRLECIRQHLHQGPQPHAVRGTLVELFRACEQRQQVDHVLLGLICHCHMLVRQRALQCIVKVLTQARNRQHTIFVFGLLHDFVLWKSASIVNALS